MHSPHAISLSSFPLWNKLALHLRARVSPPPVYVVNERPAQHYLFGDRLAQGNAMSRHNEELVVKELQELRSLEGDLQMKWTVLKRAGKGAHASFVASLRELQARTQQVERLLDSNQQRVA